MDYDSYIQELTSDSVPLDHAEYAIAEAVCDYMNKLAENAYDLYEEALQQRCQEKGQIYVTNRQTPEKFPLELFTSNIKVNRLDPAKWNATVQTYLLQHMPLASAAQPADKEEVLDRLTAVDRKIDASFPLKKDLPSGAAPFVVAIPIAIYVGLAIANVVMIGVTIGVGLYLRNEKKVQEEIWPQPPHDGGNVHGPGNIPVAGPGTQTGDGRPEPPPTPPTPIPGTTEGQKRKKDDRDKKRRRIVDRDQRRKARKDYYLGYVGRVEPAGTGFEIRVEAIEENSLSDEVFIREIEKLAVAAGNSGFGRYRLALISVFVHSVPAAVEVGKWINFKVDTTTKTPATSDSPDVSGAFTDGVTLLESLEPTLSFFNFRMECYLADNDGYIVQTDVKTITRDITASALSILQAVFSTFDFVAEAIKELLDQFMNPDSTDEPEEHGTTQGPTIQVVQAGISLPKTKTKTPRKVKIVTQSEASVKEIKAALFPGGVTATQYNLYDVGQGKPALSYFNQQRANKLVHRSQRSRVEWPERNVCQ